MVTTFTNQHVDVASLMPSYDREKKMIIYNYSNIFNGPNYILLLAWCAGESVWSNQYELAGQVQHSL